MGSGGGGAYSEGAGLVCVTECHHHRIGKMEEKRRGLGVDGRAAAGQVIN